MVKFKPAQANGAAGRGTIWALHSHILIPSRTPPSSSVNPAVHCLREQT